MRSSMKHGAPPVIDSAGRRGTVVASMRRTGLPWYVVLGIPLAVLAAYWPALQGTLVWDDDAHVARPDLRSLHGLWRIWTEPGATQQYYPMLHSAFWLEHRLWGDATLGYHLVNVGLHAGACILLFAILRRLSLPGATLAVFAFALHPVCAESVAWISEQKNTLSCLFYMASALAYLRFDEDRRKGWYFLASGLFALALFSKSVTATLPAALLVLLWFRRGRIFLRGDVLPLVPWFALGAGAGLVTAWMERTFIGAHGAAFSLSLAERCLVAGRAAWFYLGKLLWPAPLISVYPRWTIDGAAAWQYAYPAAAAVALAVLFLLRKRSRGPLAAALLFVGTLFPALGFFNVYPFVFSYVADHFQYLAAAGMISALAAGATVLADRLGMAFRTPARFAAALLVMVLGSLTWAQAGKYRDAKSFYGAILEKNPSSWLAHDNVGILLTHEGKWDEAAAHYKEAMTLNPSYPEAFNNYGNLEALKGHLPEAEEAYAGALRARPGFAAAEYDWGYALSQAERYPEAEEHLRKALSLDPAYAEAHCALANAFANTGHLPEADIEYEAALKLTPDYPDAHANLGLALAEQGRWTEAVAQVEEAVRLRPHYPEARAYLGYALTGSGRYVEALVQYDEALREGPDNPDIHYQMAVALDKMGHANEAQAQLAESRRLRARAGGH
jgi:tetratricopeptide (TPR) repeat protein